MKKNYRFYWVFVLLLLGCNSDEIVFDDLKTPRLQGVVALPIGEVTYTLRELIDELSDNSLTIEEDTNTFLSFLYFDTLDYDANEVIEILDVQNSRGIILPAFDNSLGSSSLTVPVSDQSFSFPYEGQGSERIDSLYYNDGDGSISVTSTLASNVSFNLVIDNLRNRTTGQSLTFNGTTSSVSPFQQNFSLANNKLNFSFQGQTNTFGVRLTNMQITAAPGQTGSSTDSLYLTLAFQNQTFNIVFGNLGNDTLMIGNETFDVDFFNELAEDGSIIFENPQFNFTIENTIGIPVGLSFAGVYSVKTNNNTGERDTVILGGTAARELQLIGSPTIDEIGQTITSEISLNGRNSTLDDMLATAPDQLVFSVSGITNPANQSFRQNFIDLNQTAIRAFIEMRLPMAVQLRNIQRSIDFILPENLDFDQADSLSLRVVTENLLPFNTEMDLLILDTTVTTSDSLLYVVEDLLVLATPRLDLDFISQEPEENIVNIPLSPAGIEALNSGNKIRINLLINTPRSLNSNQIFAKLLARYTLKTKISVAGKLNVKI